MEAFAKNTVRVRSGFSLSEAVPYKKDVLTVSRRQMTIGVSQDVFFNLQGVRQHFLHLVAALHGRDTDRSLLKKVVRSARREVRWNSERKNLPRSFADLMQMYLDKSTTSLRIDVLVAYHVHAVRLNFTRRRRRNMNGHGHSLLGFLPAVAVKLREGDGEEDVDESMSVLEAARLEVVALKCARARKC